MRLARHLALCIVVALLAAPGAGAKGIAAQRGPALDYLAGHVGGWGPMAANVAEAAHANGLDLATWPTPDDPVLAHVPTEFADDASNISLLRPLRALALAQHEAGAVDGELARRVLATFGPEGYGDHRALNDDAYALLALDAAGLGMDARTRAARDHLLATQEADGGWGWTMGSPSGTDMTGLVLQALAGSGGVPDGHATKARAFLATTRTGAGFAERPGAAPNCESTAWGLRATALLGDQPRDADWWFLLGLQRADGGFAHVPGGPSDLLCTTEAATLLGEARAGIVPGPSMEGEGVPALGAVAALACLAAAGRFGLRRP